MHFEFSGINDVHDPVTLVKPSKADKALSMSPGALVSRAMPAKIALFMVTDSIVGIITATQRFVCVKLMRL